MPAAVAIPAIASAAAGLGGAAISAHASGSAARRTTDAANRAAEIEAQSNREALDFQRSQAENAYKNSEATRRANYDQWAAREQRLSSIGQMLFGGGPRNIPAYVPGVDPKFDAPAPSVGSALYGGSAPASGPPRPPALDPRLSRQSIGSALYGRSY